MGQVPKQIDGDQKVSASKQEIPPVPQSSDPAAAPAPEVPKLTPAEAKAFYEKLKPFLDLGKRIASEAA
jgi:hypothetical protein